MTNEYIIVKREVVQQTLEALKQAHWVAPYGKGSPTNQAITALRSALDAKAEVEPFTYFGPDGNDGFRISSRFDPKGFPVFRHSVPAAPEVVITTNESGQCVAVTRQNEDGQIVKVIWSAPTPPANTPAWIDVSGRRGGHRGEYDWKCTKCGKTDWFASYTDPNKEGVVCPCSKENTNTDSELREAARAVVAYFDNNGIDEPEELDRLRKAI